MGFSRTIGGWFRYLASIATPDANFLAVGAKNDGRLYVKDPAGNEWDLMPSRAAWTPVSRAATGNVTPSGIRSVDGGFAGNGARVLLPSQDDPLQNGIYITSNVGPWTRSPDADGSSDFLQGKQVYVTSGSTQAGKTYVQSTSGTVTPGSTAISFTPVGDPDKLSRTLADAVGDLVVASGQDTFVRESVGADGTFYTADSAQPTGHQWRGLAEADIPASIARSADIDSALDAHKLEADPHAGYVLKSTVTAKGDLLVATAAGVVEREPVGANGTVPMCDSSTATGRKYVVNDDLLVGFEQGTLVVKTGKSRVRMPFAGIVLGVAATVDTVATGANVVIDVNKNGTTIFTTQANRPSIAAGLTSGNEAAPDAAVAAFAAGDYFTFDVDQIGSSNPGAELTITFRYRRT